MRPIAIWTLVVLLNFTTLWGAERPTVHLIGDSTVKNGRGDGAGNLWGWGDCLARHFDTNKVRILNHALGGRSSRTYLTEGLWERVRKVLKPGDYVMMQFGHNDGGEMFAGARPRASLKGNGEETREGVMEQTGESETVRTYGWYLRRYIADTMAAGSTPIVLSPVPRNLWREGKVVRANTHYGKWAAEAATEGGAAFVDLNQLVAQRYEAMGETKVRAQFFTEQDHTHTTRAGAELNGEAVAAGLRALEDVRLCNLLLAAAPAGAARPMTDPQLPKGLRLLSGPVNGVVIERGGKKLAVYGDPSGLESSAAMVLITHARRDVTWAAERLAQGGAEVVAPAREAEMLSQPEKFWGDFREKRFHDYAQQSSRLPITPLTVARSVKPGDVMSWEGLAIRVLDTPGYTRGAVSYLVELDGRTIAFTGDLMRDVGRLQDLFSFQDAIREAKIGGYHGWAGRLGELMTSLERLEAAKPDLLVPVRGAIINDPRAAIERLRSRVRAVYSNYLSIDALRWYFKDEHIMAKARRVLGPDAQVNWMRMGETFPLPPEIVPISNSRLILASDRSGFLVDCGGTGILQELRKLREAGRLNSIAHVFVTHYHDDHTEALAALVREFGAKVHATGSLVDVIERPGGYRLPCLTKNGTPVTMPHRDRDTWRWKEFRVTILDHPGQTLHHNALLVERDGGWRAFFVGDSFTPSGVDDYCLQNRNWLHPGMGYFRCLDQVEQLPPGAFLINQHVEPAFRFTPAQVKQMRETLWARIPLLAELLPFDDPNFGLDEGWAMWRPYALELRPGQSGELALRVMNHSPVEQAFRVAFEAPEGFQVSGPRTARIPARSEGALPVTVKADAERRPGVAVITADVRWEGGELRRWAEALVEVSE